ncbi:hypothetical protein [Microcoleus sp. N9_A1]|uniref:hypothetical protein n=1 Tax=Microcoleus sp. N9_A1 TaxID=3055380 RepID=UPI002FD597FD
MNIYTRSFIFWSLASDILWETDDSPSSGEHSMITLPGITIHSKIYESLASLVYRGIREQDNCAVIAKVLKQDYPSPQDLTRYRQEYEITRFLNIEGVVKAYSQQDYQRTLVILLEDFGGEHSPVG